MIFTGDTNDPRVEEFWWREAVIYQVYPRSFQDTGGDGALTISPASASTRCGSTHSSAHRCGTSATT